MLAQVPRDLRWKDLGLSGTTRFLLHFDGIMSIEVLVANKRSELLADSIGMNNKRLAEIETALAHHGLWLYTDQVV